MLICRGESCLLEVLPLLLNELLILVLHRSAHRYHVLRFAKAVEQAVAAFLSHLLEVARPVVSTVDLVVARAAVLHDSLSALLAHGIGHNVMAWKQMRGPCVALAESAFA